MCPLGPRLLSLEPGRTKKETSNPGRLINATGEIHPYSEREKSKKSGRVSYPSRSQWREECWFPEKPEKLEKQQTHRNWGIFSD